VDRHRYSRRRAAAQSVEAGWPGGGVTHKEPAQFLKQLAGRKIHNAAALELYAIDRGLINSLVARLERRVGFSVSVTDRELYVTIGADTLTGGVVRLPQ
jgi:hypothetical protein